MANKKEKEKQMQDRLQIILADLLKDDDNKYCVDCDSKGPRWASWTLGIFLCIRCAGIHRNLGVHLSRVKSVNLDSWTQQQVAMMKEIGNSRGRAIYEANLEDSFRRPQTDAALEQFIRAKYEHKRYIAKEWIPPTPTVDGIVEEMRKIEQNQNKKRINYNPSQNAPVNRKEIGDKTIITENKPQIIPNKVDLLGLENDSVTDNNIDDTFGDFVFAAQPTSTNNKSQPPPQLISSEESSSVSSAVNDLMGLNLGTDNLINNISGPSTITPNMSNSSASSVPNVGGKLDKSSILALYNNSSSNSNASNMMGQMPGSSAWPNIGGTTYQTNVMQSDLQQPGYGGGTNWMVSGQMGVPGPFGPQHNPFFNNSVFPGQPVMPISQPSLPASMAGNLSQPPNQVLW